MPSMSWHCRDRDLALDGRARIMGILNVTPDSFSDGGRYADVDHACGHAENMVEAGADIIDVGGESTRPGAAAVDEATELRRVLPVIERIVQSHDVAVSIDTRKAAVAEAALDAGAHIVNDVSAGTANPELLAIAASRGAGLVLMHMQGTPQTMQKEPFYADVVGEVAGYLGERIRAARTAGSAREALVVDPGIGFGKTLAHNLELLRGIPRLAALGYPVLVGLSRKRFLGELLGRAVDERLAGGLGAQAYAVMNGARILRVHDVKETCDAARVLAMLRSCTKL